MTNDYRQSHIQPGKGMSYQAEFSKDPHRRMVWQLEKSILDRILNTYYRDQDIHHLDFACGTGRILSYFQRRAQEAVGVDLSESMLEVARQNNTHAEIVKSDLTLDDVLGQRRFNLITAFRFFPNAQPELRRQAMQVLTRHLANNGYIVFNNHKNTGSIRNRIARLLRRGGFCGMSVTEVNELLAETGLEMVKTYHLCVVPASARRLLLPVFLLRPIEAFLSTLPFLRHFGENLVFVCRQSNKAKD